MLRKNILAVFICFGLFFTFYPVSAEMAARAISDIVPPEPPLKNPHPPVTQKDKNRVQFAQDISKILLSHKLKHDVSQKFKKLGVSSIKFSFDLTQKQILSILEPQKKATQEEFRFLFYLHNIQTRYGLLKEMRHAHIIPWSLSKDLKAKNQQKKSKPKRSSEPLMPYPKLKENEFMIHSYALFDKSRGWYLLNLILSEDKDGTIRFKRFYIKDMYQALPPGVKC